jgi:hypothetical protein
VRTADAARRSRPQLEAYVAELARRAEQVRSRAVGPEEDNMLKLTSDGRKAALTCGW